MKRDSCLKMPYLRFHHSVNKAFIQMLSVYFLAGGSERIYFTIFLASTCVTLG